MSRNKRKFDSTFFILTIILIIVGIIFFISASLGVLTNNIKVFYKMIFIQVFFGFGIGFLVLYFVSKINYKFWRKYSFYIFFSTLLLTAMVFIPKIGFSHGGALRWLQFGPINIQPVEFLKFGFIFYFASWLSYYKDKISNLKYGILPFFLLIGIIGLVLLNQPDTKSFILISLTGIAMLFFAGVKIKQILIGFLILVILFVGLSFYKPYLHQRVKTFFNPSLDPKGSSWQTQQSFIAVGSGGLTGRGYGKSIQKFTYLPEPHGDSIFAVVGEEVGFIGSFFIMILYLSWAFRGFKISNRAPDSFSRLLVFGIVILIILQSFLHIASVLGVFPMTGVPLVFMSQGGSSLLVSLFLVGIILQVSKYKINL